MNTVDNTSKIEKPVADLPEKIYAVEYAGFWDFNEIGEYDTSVINAMDYPNAEQIAKEIARRYNEFPKLISEIDKPGFEKLYNAVVSDKSNHKILPLHINANGEYLRKDLVEKLVVHLFESLKKENEELKECLKAAQKVIDQSGAADLLFWGDWKSAVDEFESLKKDKDLKTLPDKLKDFLHEEITERRDYSASKSFEVVLEKIESLLNAEKK
jgi:hypothetical protein